MATMMAVARRATTRSMAMVRRATMMATARRVTTTTDDNDGDDDGDGDGVMGSGATEYDDTTMARGDDDDEVDDEQQLIILVLFWHILCLSLRFMLISAFYADQTNYKNRAFNAHHQANAVLCISARLMLISWTIWRV
jgi:hypothetical protein